jgi:hypothetical protein
LTKTAFLTKTNVVRSKVIAPKTAFKGQHVIGEGDRKGEGKSWGGER